MKLINEIIDWLVIIGAIIGMYVGMGIFIAILIGIPTTAIVWIIQTIQG